MRPSSDATLQLPWQLHLRPLCRDAGFAVGVLAAITAVCLLLVPRDEWRLVLICEFSGVVIGLVTVDGWMELARRRYGGPSAAKVQLCSRPWIDLVRVLVCLVAAVVMMPYIFFLLIMAGPVSGFLWLAGLGPVVWVVRAEALRLWPQTGCGPRCVGAAHYDPAAAAAEEERQQQREAELRRKLAEAQNRESTLRNRAEQQAAEIAEFEQSIKEQQERINKQESELTECEKKKSRQEELQALDESRKPIQR